jgi:hypothetical protein
MGNGECGIFERRGEQSGKKLQKLLSHRGPRDVKTSNKNSFPASKAQMKSLRGSYFPFNFDELVKSRNSIEFVIPAKAGIQLFQDGLDPGFRRGDAPRDFLRDHQN